MYAAAYRSIDGVRIRRTFKTLPGLRRFINKWVGLEAVEPRDFPDDRAVSFDGVGIVSWHGATGRQILESTALTTQPQEDNMNTETTLNGDEYIIANERTWFTAGKFSVLINHTPEGVIVDIYTLGNEDMGTVASAWANNNDAE